MKNPPFMKTINRREKNLGSDKGICNISFLSPGRMKSLELLVIQQSAGRGYLDRFMKFWNFSLPP